MRIERPSRSPTSDASLIPMINVVFLLLVFFMVAGTVRPSEPLEVTPPESARFADAPVARRTLHLAADGTLVLDDEPVGIATLAPALARSAAPSAVRGGAAGTASAPTSGAAPADGATGRDRLALRADAGTSFASLRGTIDALRAAGIEEVELITVRVPAAGS